MKKMQYEHKYLNTWYSGGHWKAQCQSCYKHGLVTKDQMKKIIKAFLPGGSGYYNFEKDN